MIGTGCSHSQKFFYRQLWQHGNGFHIVEWCPACRHNVRGSGVFVAQAEVIALGWQIDQLPFLPRCKPQPGLFDEQEAGQ